MRKILVLGTALVGLSGCYMTEIQVASHLWKRASGGSGTCSDAQPHLKVGNPYTIKGVKYYPKKSSYGYREEGIASWYGADFHEKLTANGECYDMYALTAAHKTLPLPTTVRVTNLENGRSIVLRVNDRGPYAKGRIIDLSYAAAQQLGMAKQGVAPVRVEAIGGPHHRPGGADTRVVKNSQKEAARTMLTQRVTTTPAAKKTTVIAKNEPVAGGSFTKRVAKPEPVVVKKPVSQPGTFTRRVTATKLEPAAGDVVVQVEEETIVAEAVADQAVPATVVEDLPPPPEKVPETSATPLTGGVKLYVQTGAFSSQSNAVRQLEELRKLTGDALLSEVERAGRTLHRVRSGPYASVAEADTMLAKLVDAGFNTAVIAVDQ